MNNDANLKLFFLFDWPLVPPQAPARESRPPCDGCKFRNQFVLLCDIMGSRITGDPARPPIDTPAWCEGLLTGMRFVVGYGWATTWPPEAAHVMARTLPRPSCIYVGIGLWTMWPVPYTKPRHAWTVFRTWLDYKRLAQEAFTRYAELAPLIVASTPHSMCDDWFIDLDRKYVPVSGKRENFAIPPCARWLVSKGFASSEKEGRQYCSQGLRQRSNAIVLAEKIQSAVAVWNAKRTIAIVGNGGNTVRKDSNATAVMLDAFSLTDKHCEEHQKGDAVHFHSLVSLELLALFDLLGLGVGVPEKRTFTCERVPT